MSKVLILGAGYTGGRVAGLLAGHDVRALHRTDIDFTAADAVARLREIAPVGCLVLHSIPSLPDGEDRTVLAGLEGRAQRVVYLSTTGVYGDAEIVDETTPIAPRNPREQARADTEAAVLQGPWESLVLRPAAIYGLGRGVHVSMAQGKYTLMGDGGNFISRIHVDDLARIAAAAIESDLTGAYPVADEHPCTSREIADYCSQHFGLAPAVSVDVNAVPPTRRNNRQVDGRAIVRLLGLQLAYPSYRTMYDAMV